VINKRTGSLILIIVFSASLFLSSCRGGESDGGGYVFRANLLSNPQNLDPQLAADASSKAIIVNTFTGLVRFSNSGAIELHAAEDYSISDDGLIYTFKLRENIFWMGSGDYTAPLTAYDFVFAFERVLDENTYSPHASVFSSVKNVYALDDFTLVFELRFPYFKFIENLTHTAAMPCNREFFNMTKGRYGLSADAVLSCGAFYIKEWNFDPYWFDNYILLQKNTLNNEWERIYPSGVRYFITGANTDIEDFSDKNIDCFILTGYDKKIVSGNEYTAYQSKSYGLLFNLESELWSDFDMRYALAAAVDRGEFGGLPENLSPAYGIVPGAVTVLGRSYREMFPDNSLLAFDARKAASLWVRALGTRNIVSLDNIRITVPDGFNGDLSVVTQQWQKAYGFFCGIETVSQSEYLLKLGEGRYDIALVELGGDFNDPVSFFKASGLQGGSGDARVFDALPRADSDGEQNDEVRSQGEAETVLAFLEKIESAERLSDAVQLYRAAETLILSDCAYIPLFYGDEYFIYGAEVRDLIYYPFTEQIYFGYGKR
jgi:oligopeptide transport system substrate-binding protein